jgi:peptidoglycan-associated lipoprotein
MMTLNHPCIAASLIALSVSLFACADAAKPPQSSAVPTPARDEASQANRSGETKDDDGNSGSIVVDKEIADLCKLPTAHFAFDRSNIREESSDALDALATCLSSGPLKGRPLNLVGHADPRGEPEYNFALGQRRAGSVEAYLAAHGIQRGIMTTSSRGETDASGDDAASWAKDRKVEILLARK